jgi:voltage-gated potassium channel
VAGDDAINIVVTWRPRAQSRPAIVARAIRPTEDKLRRAGATHVISPYRIGGRRIVTQLLHPLVTDFLDIVMHRRDLGLWLEEIAVAANAPADGRPLGETKFWGPEGVRVLTIASEGGDLVTSPRGGVTLPRATWSSPSAPRSARGRPRGRRRRPCYPGRAGRDPR